MSKNKKHSVKSVKHGRTGYLIVTAALNQELHTYGTVPGLDRDQYRLASTLKEAHKIIQEEAATLQTADSSYAVQDISEFDNQNGWLFHGLAHVYFDEHLKPVAEADADQAKALGWYSVMFDIYKLTVE